MCAGSSSNDDGRWQWCDTECGYGSGDDRDNGFVDELSEYAAKWANSYSNDVHHARQTTPLGEIREFYDAMQPQLDRIFNYLDSFELSALPEEAQTLLYLTFGFHEHGAWPA